MSEETKKLKLRADGIDGIALEVRNTQYALDPCGCFIGF